MEKMNEALKIAIFNLDRDAYDLGECKGEAEIASYSKSKARIEWLLKELNENYEIKRKESPIHSSVVREANPEGG